MGAANTDRSPGFDLTAWRAALLAVSLVVVSVARYVTGPGPGLPHELSLRLYYLPILIGAYWYGVAGGLVVALLSSVAYVNRVLQISYTLDPARLAEVVVFHLVGLSVGLLASAQRRVAVRYQQSAATLEMANAQLRESVEQIRRIDRLKTLGEVATGLAHELRHPLASIGGAAEIVKARAPEGSPEAEFSTVALAEVQRLDRLVWEFLRYARPHAPEMRETMLHDVVAQAVTLLRIEAERASVSLDLQTEGSSVPPLSIDPVQMEQVLLNVILNAIQATPAGGRIVVRERVEHQEACVDVIDQGGGIAPENLSKIFSPFFTTREKGTGLGLAIAQRIVVSHGGHLEVARTSANGSWFEIRLPLNVAGAAVRPRAAAAAV